MHPGGTIQPRYEEFRDGVNVTTDMHLALKTSAAGTDEVETSVTPPLVEAFRYSRLAGATRCDYKATGGSLDVGAAPDKDVALNWLRAVRENEMTAQDAGNDLLLLAVAVRLRHSLGDANERSH